MSSQVTTSGHRDTTSAPNSVRVSQDLRRDGETVLVIAAGGAVGPEAKRYVELEVPRGGPAVRVAWRLDNASDSGSSEGFRATLTINGDANAVVLRDNRIYEVGETSPYSNNMLSELIEFLGSLFDDRKPQPDRRAANGPGAAQPQSWTFALQLIGAGASGGAAPESIWDDIAGALEAVGEAIVAVGHAVEAIVQMLEAF